MMKTYECAVCHETVTEPWNDEIARAEFERDWPEHKFDPETLELVCDSCDKEIKLTLGRKRGSIQ